MMTKTRMTKRTPTMMMYEPCPFARCRADNVPRRMAPSPSRRLLTANRVKQQAPLTAKPSQSHGMNSVSLLDPDTVNLTPALYNTKASLGLECSQGDAMMDRSS